jgi:hypothetical protein
MDLPFGKGYIAKSVKIIGVNIACLILQMYEEAKFSVTRNVIRKGNRLKLIVIFRVMVPCDLVGGYQCFG